MTQILALDIAGNPFRWLDVERAIYYAASGKVAWELGEDHLVFRGGTQRNGLRSEIAIRPVIALAKSEAMVRHMLALPLGHDNSLLFRRDREICGYCGERYARRELTRDHLLPRARGGKDVWSNVVTACQACNTRKACRTPEEARMPLLYVPYEPCRFEHFILSGRRILVDQMEYLAARLPGHSRAVSSQKALRQDATESSNSLKPSGHTTIHRLTSALTSTEQSAALFGTRRCNFVSTENQTQTDIKEIQNANH